MADGPGILVTSAQERFGLAACRTLAAAGYRVGAVADQTPAAAHWSRCCSARHVLVDAKADPDAFVAGLAAIGGPYAMLLPATDAALLAVSRRRDRLGDLELGLPPHEAVEAATDKVELDRASREAGLPSPDTAVCHDHDDGVRAARELGLPLVIKPRRTAFEDGGVIRQRGGSFVADESALADAVEQFGTPYLLQRLQEGEVWSAAGVMTPEGVLSFSVARYLRTWPVKAGNVAAAITVDPPGDLRERVSRLLAELGWTGLFELELIRSAAGTFHAIDLNPRLYGSLAHASRAGAPHAAIFCDWVLGRDPAPATARPGVRYRWEDAEVRHAVAQLRAGNWRAAAQAVRPYRDVAHAHFRLDDPAPLAARALLLLRQRSRS